jgi:hypothetical protein
MTDDLDKMIREALAESYQMYGDHTNDAELQSLYRRAAQAEKDEQ